MGGGERGKVPFVCLFLHRLTLSIYNGVIHGHVNRLNHVQCVFARPSPIRSLSLTPLLPHPLCMAALPLPLSPPSPSLSHTVMLIAAPLPRPSHPLRSLYILCTLKGREEEEEWGGCYSHLASSPLFLVHLSASRCNRSLHVPPFACFFSLPVVVDDSIPLDF